MKTQEEIFLEIDKEEQQKLFLIEKYLRKTITKQEHDDLDKWIVEDESNIRLFEVLSDPCNRRALRGIARALKDVK
jgi:hypothetical protein